MRKRFEQQYTIGLKRIEDTEINSKSRDALPKLIAALKELYTNEKYNKQLFSVLEKKIILPKQKTGRKGMNLWQIFVLAQIRMSLNISYDSLHNLADYHENIRQILGIETEWGVEKVKLKYQNIVDNVKLLDDNTVKELNGVIVQTGHDVFKKKVFFGIIF